MTAGRPRRLDEEPVAAGRIPRYQIPAWGSALGIVAGVTAAGPDFRLAPHSAAVAAPERWRELIADAGEGFRSGVVARQVHGSEVRAWHRDLASGLAVAEGVDGHVTTDTGILLTVTVADCVPVYLVQSESGAVALLHAGWRGVAGGILEAGVAQLLEVGGGSARTVVMHCGISICGSCYEVGSEVFEALGMRVPPGRGRLDLRLELARRARELGVGSVTVSGWCTAHDGGRFHSHRGSAGAAGRMAAYLGRAPA